MYVIMPVFGGHGQIRKHFAPTTMTLSSKILAKGWNGESLSKQPVNNHPWENVLFYSILDGI